MGLVLIGWLVLLLGAGLAVSLVRARWRRDATAARGRRRDLLCGLALFLLAGSYLVEAGSTGVPGRTPGWLLAAVVCSVGVLFVRPRLLPGVLAICLIPLGLYGFVEIRDAFWWPAYGIVPYTNRWALFAVLPQAYLFLSLGGAVGLLAADRRSVIGRTILGPVGQLDRRAQLRALLLPLVVMMAAVAVAPQGWMGSWRDCVLSLLVVAAAILVSRQVPRLAAGLATCGLLVLGLVGLVATVQAGAHGPAVLGLADLAGTGWPSVYWMGLGVRAFILLQSVVFVGASAALAPRTIPGVRRLTGTADLELLARVRRLTESRAVAVDTAAADLRRLERDLHDGAQARLVALGMQLRAVEKLIATSPEAAAALVAEARDTSARALADLRELVRGVHPPVLADRGLADAIRALALDSPLHVETETDLDGRAPAPIETACYFAVAELLTNAAKHSGARDARVAVEHHGRMLRLSVTDFGLGGADPASGTGLAGIERRLAAFDGILAVSSPAGGPTTIVIEVPCALAPAPLRS